MPALARLPRFEFDAPRLVSEMNRCCCRGVQGLGQGLKIEKEVLNWPNSFQRF